MPKKVINCVSDVEPSEFGWRHVLKVVGGKRWMCTPVSVIAKPLKIFVLDSRHQFELREREVQHFPLRPKQRVFVAPGTGPVHPLHESHSLRVVGEGELPELGQKVEADGDPSRYDRGAIRANFVASDRLCNVVARG